MEIYCEKERQARSVRPTFGVITFSINIATLQTTRYLTNDITSKLINHPGLVLNVFESHVVPTRLFAQMRL